MDKLTKIGDITKQFNITGRTLRYYEEIGLLSSQRKNDNKYRYYDRVAIQRLKQIITLRKLQIPIKDIKEIFEKRDMSTLLGKLRQRL